MSEQQHKPGPRARYTARVVARVADRIRIKLEEIAARQDRLMSEVTREALTEFAERFHKGGRKP